MLDTDVNYDVLLFRPSADRLGLQLHPVEIGLSNQFVRWVTEGNVILLPHWDRRQWGRFTERMAVCDVPVNPSVDGVVGWPLIDERITQFDAMAGKFEFLRKVPKDAKGWAKFGVRTDVHVLTLEILNQDGSTTGIVIDTGNLADPGILLSAPRWDQWKAAHPKTPTGVWGDIGINGLTLHERTWTHQFSLGGLELTNVKIDRFEPPPGWASNYVVAKIGFEMLKRFNLIVDGKHGVAYLQPSKLWKASMADPPGLSLLLRDGGGVVFAPRDLHTDDLLAYVTDGGPAFGAGVRTGDVLVKVDNQDLTQWLANPGGNWRATRMTYLARLEVSTNSPPGRQVKLTLKRDDQTFQAIVLQKNVVIIGSTNEIKAPSSP